MKTFVTKIKAVYPGTTKPLLEWYGPSIKAETKEEAQKYCVENGLGYCEVGDELVTEIPYSTAEFATKLDNPN